MKGGKEQGMKRREWEGEMKARFLRLVKVVCSSEINEVE